MYYPINGVFLVLCLILCRGDRCAVAVLAGKQIQIFNECHSSSISNSYHVHISHPPSFPPSVFLLCVPSPLPFQICTPDGPGAPLPPPPCGKYRRPRAAPTFELTSNTSCCSLPQGETSARARASISWWRELCCGCFPGRYLSMTASSCSERWWRQSDLLCRAVMISMPGTGPG